jgi:hypothetical protein
MNPEQFVSDLKTEVRNSVDGTIEYLANPPVKNPPDHLGVLSNWYRNLSNADKEVAKMAMEYAAEGSLFSLLNILDGMHYLPSSIAGELELYYVEDDKRIRLNDPEEHFLYDIFNNL